MSNQFSHKKLWFRIASLTVAMFFLFSQVELGWAQDLRPHLGKKPFKMLRHQFNGGYDVNTLQIHLAQALG